MKLIIKLLKFVAFIMIFLSAGPYILAITLYFILKKYARSDTALEESVIEMEVALMNLSEGLISLYTPLFITAVVFSIIALFFIMYFLKKYKIIIPRRTIESKDNLESEET